MDDNGEYVGFDLDLAEEVCKRNGWKLVKRPIAWDSKDSELATGAISCIWNGFTMNGREDDYTWSTAYVDNSQVVIVKKDSNVHKLSDLKGKRLIVPVSYTHLICYTIWKTKTLFCQTGSSYLGNSSCSFNFLWM